MDSVNVASGFRESSVLLPCLPKGTGIWSPFPVSGVQPGLRAQFGVLEPVLLSRLENALSLDLLWVVFT